MFAARSSRIDWSHEGLRNDVHSPTRPRSPIAPFGLQWSDSVPILSSSTVPDLILELSRERFDGTLFIEEGDSRAELCFLGGLLAGAWDNAPEGQLGPRLLRAGLVDASGLKQAGALGRSRGLRLGAALLSLNLIAESALFEALRQQAFERMVIAVGWPSGRLRFDLDVARARTRAVGLFSPVRAILTWFLRHPNAEAQHAWLRENSAMPLRCSLDFEEHLDAYVELAPETVLPSMLLGAEQLTVAEIAERTSALGLASKEEGAADLMALYMSGMVEDARRVTDPRGLPRVQRRALALVDVDEPLVSAVRTEWLRVQGASYYDVIGVPPDVSSEVIEAALTAQRARFEAGVKGKNLGAASSLAMDVRAIYDDVEAVLCSPPARERYDRYLLEAPGSTLSVEAAAALQEGQDALQQERLAEAAAALQRAAASAPEHPEVLALLGWTRFLDGNAAVEEALLELKRAKLMDPVALGPTLFLGLAAELVGDLESARGYLEEAQQRFPRDPVVVAAAQRLGLPAAEEP